MTNILSENYLLWKDMMLASCVTNQVLCQPNTLYIDVTSHAGIVIILTDYSECGTYTENQE